jgi:hypothetical protein
MSRVSPPRGYIDHEQPPFPAGPPRRRKRQSRSDQLLERLRLFGIRRAFLGATVLTEITLLLIALVPQSIWAGLGYPTGPIPTTLAPLVAGAFYLLPAVTGALCQSWKRAVALATLPAWLDLGIFAIAAAGRTGPFYLVSDPHAVSTVGTLELFAVLGTLGWLARTSLLGMLKPGRGGGS